MSFVRTKKINGHEYAYLVANSWKREKVKQRVKKYLGKVVRFERKDSDFFSFIGMEQGQYIKKKSFSEIVEDLVTWELVNHGFKMDGGKLSCGAYAFNRMKLFHKGRKAAVLATKEGFLYHEGIRKLLQYEGEEDRYLHEGYNLARAFIENGIQIPQELFVAVYNKFFR